MKHKEVTAIKITRQSDYYGLDYRYSVPTSLAQPATKPPVGLEDMLKSKSVTPGSMLHNVNQALNATPSQDTGPDRWPAVLPGDQLVNAIGGTEHNLRGILPKIPKPKAVPKPQAPVKTSSGFPNEQRSIEDIMNELARAVTDQSGVIVPRDFGLLHHEDKIHPVHVEAHHQGESCHKNRI